MDNLGKRRGILERGLEELGLSLEKSRIEQMLEYGRCSISESTFQLNGFKNPEEILRFAILDSLTVFSHAFEEKIERLGGCGEGRVPAIPIKIFYPGYISLSRV